MFLRKIASTLPPPPTTLIEQPEQVDQLNNNRGGGGRDPNGNRGRHMRRQDHARIFGRGGPRGHGGKQLQRMQSEDAILNYQRSIEEFGALIGEEKYQKSLLDILQEIDPEKQIDAISLQMKIVKNQQMNIEKIDNHNYNKKEFICPICYDNVGVEDLQFSIAQCGHSFHLSCLADAVEFDINSRKFPVKCPLFECNNHLPEWEIRIILKDTKPQLMDKFIIYLLKWTVMQEKGLSFCPTPDCTFVYESLQKPLKEEVAICNMGINPGAQQKQIDPLNFQCPRCLKNICLSCNTPAHQDKSCEEYKKLMKKDEVEKAEREELKKTGIQICPSCSLLVQLENGCNLIECKCGEEFCYCCGACEINNHRCINGCPQFGFDDPKQIIQDELDRDPTPEEIAKTDEITKQFLDQNAEYIKIVRDQYKADIKDNRYNNALYRIDRNIGILDQKRDNFVNAIRKKQPKIFGYNFERYRSRSRSTSPKYKLDTLSNYSRQNQGRRQEQSFSSYGSEFDDFGQAQLQDVDLNVLGIRIPQVNINDNIAQIKDSVDQVERNIRQQVQQDQRRKARQLIDDYDWAINHCQDLIENVQDIMNREFRMFQERMKALLPVNGIQNGNQLQAINQENQGLADQVAQQPIRGGPWMNLVLLQDDEEVKKGGNQEKEQGGGSINLVDEKGEYENALSIAANQKDQMFSVGLQEEGNYKNWIVKIKGPVKSLYEGIIFEVKVTAKNGEYVANFLTPILHPTYKQNKEIGPIKSGLTIIFEILHGLRAPYN